MLRFVVLFVRVTTKSYVGFTLLITFAMFEGKSRLILTEHPSSKL
jgi:general stress protein CsbA